MLNNENVQSFLWPCEFACTIVSEKLIIPNYYNLKLNIEPAESKTSDINTGFKKLKYFVSNCLQNSILIHQKNPLLINLKEIESNFVLLPAEPYDYFFASVLFNKLSKIVENYFLVNYLELFSSIGDHVEYTVNHGNKMKLDTNNKYWWNTDTVNTGQTEHITWEELNIIDSPKFMPKIVKGGLSE